MSRAQIIHNFGRAEDVDKDGLKRLIRSIARELDPADEAAVLSGRDVTVLESRDLGGVWVLDQLWRRLKIDTAIRTVARGRRVDVEAVERVLFALVAGRALAPSSKLEACRWICQEVHIAGLEQTDADTCYRAMDFLLDALDELQESVFFTVADLLQLDVDVLFLDTAAGALELLVDLACESQGYHRFRSEDPMRPPGSWSRTRSPRCGTPSATGTGS